MISGVVVATAIVLTVAGLGAPAAKWLLADMTPGQQWLLAPLLGTIPLAVLVLGMGVVSYTPGTMAACLGAGLSAALAGLWAGRPTALQRLPLGRSEALIALLLAVIVLVALLSAFAPPTDNDTLRYHLTLPRRDLELGRISFLYGWSVYEFFPPLVSMPTHLAYALGGPVAAQLLGVAWLGAAAAAASLLTLRLGGNVGAALLAALILVSQRVLINLGSAVSVDTALAAFVGAALLLTCRPRTTAGSGYRGTIALGLLLGAALNVKYHAAFAVAGVLAAELGLRLYRRASPFPAFAAGVVAVAMIAPLMVHNMAVTGNPVFPVFHHVISPNNANIFAAYLKAVGVRDAVPGGGWLLPFTMFLHQTRFDGFQFGFPIILIALPFAFAFATRRPERIACLGVIGLYVAAWWLVMPHLLRFHQAVFAPMAALSALGLASAWVAARQFAWSRAAFLGLCLTWALVQSLFLASTAQHRLPAAFGRVDAVALLEQAEYVHYSLISPCRWIEANLQPGQRYLALVNDPSAYCPQASAMIQVRPDEAAAFYSRHGLPRASPQDLADRLEQEDVRYVLVSNIYGTDDDPMVFGKHRYDSVVVPALRQLAPLGKWPSGMVYDARTLISALRHDGEATPRKGS